MTIKRTSPWLYKLTSSPAIRAPQPDAGAAVPEAEEPTSPAVTELCEDRSSDENASNFFAQVDEEPPLGVGFPWEDSSDEYNAEEGDFDEGEDHNRVHTTTTPLLTGEAVVELLSNSTPVENVEARAAKLRLGMELCFEQEYIHLKQVAVSDE